MYQYIHNYRRYILSKESVFVMISTFGRLCLKMPWVIRCAERCWSISHSGTRTSWFSDCRASQCDDGLKQVTIYIYNKILCIHMRTIYICTQFIIYIL